MVLQMVKQYTFTMMWLVAGLGLALLAAVLDR
jgi:hypothetical protein